MKRIILCLAFLSGLSFADDGFVARAMFTTNVQDREPVDTLITVPNEIGRVYFFSELRDLQDKKVSHKWYYQNRLMADIVFHPKGDRWRVHSYKTVLPHWLGSWRVDVVVNDDRILETHRFDFVESDELPNEELVEEIDLQTMEEQIQELSTPTNTPVSTDAPTADSLDNMKEQLKFEEANLEVGIEEVQDELNDAVTDIEQAEDQLTDNMQ